MTFTSDVRIFEISDQIE